MERSAQGAGSERFVREKGQAAQLAALAEPVLLDLGFRLVRVVVSGRDGGTVQIMAERPDGTMTVEDCAVVSRNLSPVLDAHDPISGSYRLEISSPGIDRPLVRPTDFEDWTGHEARIELTELIDGRKRFKGRLEGYEAGEVRIAVEVSPAEGAAPEKRVIGLPVALIDSAKLVLTDKLLALARSRQSAGEQAIVARAEAEASASGLPPGKRQRRH